MAMAARRRCRKSKPAGRSSRCPDVDAPGSTHTLRPMHWGRHTEADTLRAVDLRPWGAGEWAHLIDVRAGRQTSGPEIKGGTTCVTTVTCTRRRGRPHGRRCPGRPAPRRSWPRTWSSSASCWSSSGGSGYRRPPKACPPSPSPCRCARSWRSPPCTRSSRPSGGNGSGSAPSMATCSRCWTAWCCRPGARWESTRSVRSWQASTEATGSSGWRSRARRMRRC